MTHNVYLASSTICKPALFIGGSSYIGGVVEWWSGIDTRLEMWAEQPSPLDYNYQSASNYFLLTLTQTPQYAVTVIFVEQLIFTKTFSFKFMTKGKELV